MALLNRKKLNTLMTRLQSGQVLTTEELEKQGISPNLAYWYVQSGWLERLSDKAYKKAGDNISWAGALSALQNQLSLSIHVGGKTALELLGQAHFIPLGDVKNVILFTIPSTKIPRWFNKNNLWGTRFYIYKTVLFGQKHLSLGLIERQIDSMKLILSSPERAVMEMLYLVPREQTFEEAKLLMENLAQLRPTVVQLLLENCFSIKVKRLFLHLAEQYQHSWVAELNLKKIYLGHGKRVIGKGGEYHSKYQLSLPKLMES